MFQLKQSSYSSFDQIFQKKGNPSSRRDDEHITEFKTFELVYMQNFILTKEFWFFGLNLSKKEIYYQKRKKQLLQSNPEYLN